MVLDLMHLEVFCQIVDGIVGNVILFGADMSSLVHSDRKKGILIAGKGPTYGLDGDYVNQGKKYLISFTEQEKKICLSLSYNGVNSYLFVNDVEIYKLKAKDSEMQLHYICIVFQKTFQLIL